MYASHILEATEDETPRLEDYQVLQEFKDVFPNEIPGLPPKRDIDARIEDETTRDARIEDATTRVVGK